MRTIARTSSVLSALLAFTSLACGQDQPTPTDPADWELAERGVSPVAITEREGSYSYLLPTLVTSEPQLHNTIATLGVIDVPTWGHTSYQDLAERSRARLTEEFADAHIDFEKEAVVIFPRHYGSGSIRVWLSEPQIEGDTLKLYLSNDRPSLLTMDMAYRVFVVRFPKSLAAYVEFPKPRGGRITLRVR